MFGDPRLPERFWDKVHTEPNSGCWLWTGGTNGVGYGQIRLPVSQGSRSTTAHRWLYSVLVKEVPASLHVDHLCRTRCCVNPAHLEAVTPWENIRRGESLFAKNHFKTACKNGHEFDEQNTYWYKGGRQCQACRRNHRAASRRRKSDSRRSGSC